MRSLSKFNRSETASITGENESLKDRSRDLVKRKGVQDRKENRRISDFMGRNDVKARSNDDGKSSVLRATKSGSRFVSLLSLGS